MSNVIAVILLILIAFIIIVIVWNIVVRYTKEEGETFELRRKLADETMDIDEVEGDMADPSIVTITLGKGSGRQILEGINQSQLNRTIVIVEEYNETIIEEWNETIIEEWNETIIEEYTITQNITYDLVSVNDISGSMIGNKIKELRGALRPFIKSVLNATGNRMGLVSYDSDIVEDACHPISDDLASLENTLYNLIASSGWTCICCGVNRATDYLKNSAKAKIMVVMSDGNANYECNPHKLYQDNTTKAEKDAIQSAKEAYEIYDITVYTIGFGHDADESTLQKMANAGNGSYYFSDVSELAETFEELQKNITIIEEKNVTKTREVNITKTREVTTTKTKELNVTKYRNVTIEIYGPKEPYDHLKVIFYSETSSYEERIPFSDIPGPLEDETYAFNLSGKIKNIIRIEIYPVAYTSSGIEVIGPRLSVWEPETEFFSLRLKVLDMFRKINLIN